MDLIENLNVVFIMNVVLDIVLGSLGSSYDNFIMSYHSNSMAKVLMEIYNLL